MGPPSSFAFGPFVLHTLSRRLEKQGELVLVNSRATELLLLLVRRAGELVTKDDLLHAGWGNRVVAENNLTVHMAALRRVLRDGGEADTCIRTEHGRGYRFVMPVKVAQAAEDNAPRAPAVRVAGQLQPSGISIQVPPVQGLADDEESGSLAAETRRHLMVELSRMPDASVTGSGDARYVLRTSVRPGKGGAQVVAMIDDSASGATIWAERFDHRHVGLAPIESEISSRLARAVVTELVDREAAQDPTEQGADARHSALRGWSALNRELWVPQDLAEARRSFDRALRADPSNASALAGSAYAIVAENIRATPQGRDLGIREELLQADELATRAVARAPDWPRAWFCRGYVRQCQRRFDAALTAYGRALALDPCDAETLAYAGHVHFLMGRLEEMRTLVRHALALGPRDRGVGFYHHFLGQYDFWQGRDDLAIAHFVQASDLAPSLVYCATFLAASLALAGRVEEGRRSLDAWCEAMGGFHLTIDRLRAQVFSDHPTYLAGHERQYRGLRLIGVAES
jgi:DNA-binding winged helix-turn-helix (wHTH) protein/tetratricopeptide (TPR) repeat protein